ncbi:hypothetical protein Scep_023412 [Stephania cephalantha]|uniref:Transmembrane protein n=1 Tax=Stephania cephalantha TaxID=152367 RepID=A0AAP0EXJ4_9MAGN
MNPSPKCHPELTQSLKIITTNPRLFLSIYTLLALPLSLTIFSSILISRPLKAQISLKSDLKSRLSTSMESGMVFEEIQSDTLTLIHVQALHFFPSYALSLLATVTAVDAAAAAVSGEFPSLKTAWSAVKVVWMRPLVTCIYVYALICGYNLMVFVLGSMVNSSSLMGILVISSRDGNWPNWVVEMGVVVFRAVLEVYAAAVFSMGVVVAVVEERYGWGAVREGWVLVGKRRFSGWGLAGFLVVVSRGVLWGFEGVSRMDGQDLLGVFERVVLVCFFGWLVLWGCVVNTVFYFECQRLYVERLESQRFI